jgi:hypothetical protein
MAKNPNLIQFTMTADHRDKLTSLKEDESSIDLVAKRLLIGLLDDKIRDRPSHDSLEEIRDQLADHETRLKALEDPDHPIDRFLSKENKTL